MSFSNISLYKFLIYLSCLIVPLLVTGPFLADLLLSLLSLWFLYYIIKNKKYYVFKNIFFYIFLSFCLVCIFSSLMSDDILHSFESSLFYFRIGIFSLLISYLIKNDEDIFTYFFYTIVFTFCVIIFYAIIQYLLQLNTHPSRVSSFFGDELIMGSYLSRLLPLTIALFLFKSNKTKIGKYAFTIFLSFTYFSIFLSGERAAFFYVNMSILFMCLFIRISLKWLLLFTISTIFIFYTLIVNLNYPTGDNLVNRYTRNIMNQMNIKKEFYNKIGFEEKLSNSNKKKELKIDLKATENKQEQKKVEQSFAKEEGIVISKKIFLFTAGHDSLYRTAFNMFLDRPIIGHGPKMFRVKCSDPKYAEGVAPCMTHPHNFYIQLLAETGIIGFSFLFFLFIYLIFISSKYFYYFFFKKEKIYSNYQICLLACLLITVWPFIPNGNFFNNYLMILYCLPLGFLKKKIKN